MQTGVSLDIQAVKAAVEAVLFASEKPLTLAQVTGALEGVERKVVHQVLDELRAEYDEQGRGFRVAEIAEGWQLLTRSQHAAVIRRLHRMKSANRLTRPSLETLAIIGYKQPLTKAEIEAIRGVNSDGVMHSLLERRLVRTVGRKDVAGRPLLYGTTREFLQAFGLKDLGELPKLTELKELLKQAPEGELWEVGDDGKLREKPLEELRNIDGPFVPLSPDEAAAAEVATPLAEVMADEDDADEMDDEDEDDADEEDDEDDDEDDEDEDEEAGDEPVKAKRGGKKG
jgi:segregation and condensation protein B